LLFEHFETRFQIFVLQFGIGEQDVFFFGQGGQGGLDRENDEGGQEEFGASDGQGGMGFEVEIIHWPHEIDEESDEQNVDGDLDCETNDGWASGGFEAVCDPLVDRPQQEKKEEADEPGFGYPARLPANGEEVIVQEADARHEEGAEQGEQDLSACLFG
jgi:hypothetical protein